MATKSFEMREIILLCHEMLHLFHNKIDCFNQTDLNQLTKSP